jgi:hypothetical protein
MYPPGLQKENIATMSTNTDDILTVIDHALEDYDTSVDAMRWTAESVKPQSSKFMELNSGTLVVFTSLTDFMSSLRAAILDATPVITVFSNTIQPLTQLLHNTEMFWLTPPRVDSARQRHLATQLRQRDRRRARHTARNSH